MRLPEPLFEASLLRRVTRFSVLVEREGRQELVYLANSGRLQELLRRGRVVFLAERPTPDRKTHYDLVLVKLDSQLISADARLPNEIVAEALREGKLAPFRHYSQVQREVRFGQSRLDFSLRDQARTCYLEVKSVTLVKEGCALFPDAPTSRGTRHLENLQEARKAGHEAAVIFIVQREDARVFSPHDGADKRFGEQLRRAAAEGVGVFAYRCQVTLKEMRLSQEIPVLV